MINNESYIYDIHTYIKTQWSVDENMNRNCIIKEFLTPLSPMMWEYIDEQMKLE